jgi:hypothetical protein
VVLTQAGTALCRLGTFNLAIQPVKLVAAQTSTNVGLPDSMLVTRAGVGLWYRQESHANSNKPRNPLC